MKTITDFWHQPPGEFYDVVVEVPKDTPLASI